MNGNERLLGAGLRGIETLLRPGVKQQAKDNKNFLLPQFQLALGTVVHATPLVEALKEQVPDARIIVASSGIAAQVWEGNPHLEQLLCVPSPLQDVRAAVRGLRKASMFGGQPYTALLTVGNERTKITVASVLAGPSRRIGFTVQKAMLDIALNWDEEKSQIDNNLRLLPYAISNATQPDQSLEPKIYPVRSRGRAASLLPVRGRALRIALATQTSITQRKKWRDERWIELLTVLNQVHSIELVFIGAESEAPAIDALRSRVPFPTVSVAGKTTIQELAAVLETCDFGIMLDTGPLHVGRAVQLPIVIIAPAWSPELEWLPVGNPRFRILKNGSFPPPAPDDYVIDEVSVEDVLHATEDLMTALNLRSSNAAAERIQES